MTQAQVQAVIAALFGIIGGITGLLTTVTLLLPNTTDRATNALNKSGWRCLAIGIVLLIPIFLGIVLLRSPQIGSKLIGIVLLIFMSGIATVGGAGIAQKMGQRVGELSGARSTYGSLVRGCLSLSVAALFPLIGWYLIAPAGLACALGAGLIACLPLHRPAPITAVVENG